MLGWEFPPHLNGGLGVATAGLAEALAPLSSLTLVLPRSQSSRTANGLEIMNMHGKRLPAIHRTFTQLERHFLQEVEWVSLPYSITGYEGVESGVNIDRRISWKTVEKWLEIQRLERPESQFVLNQLYGGNLIQKVGEFTEVVLEYTLTREFDVIHAHDWMTFLAGVRLKEKTGKPLVLHVHSLEYDRSGPDSKGWVWELEQEAMEKADAIIPVSEYTANILRNAYGISPVKIHPVLNGINPITPYRSPKPFSEPLIAFLGRITQQKGPVYFFNAALYLLRKRPGLRFVIAGKGDEIEGLIRKSVMARVNDRIHFTGHLDPDRAQDLLAMSDVFVLPSVSEPFGLAALEAAQMQVPCIISENSGVGEVLKGAVSVDYQDVKAMAGLIERLLDDRPLRKQVIAEQNEALTHASWPSAAMKVLEIYKDVLR